MPFRKYTVEQKASAVAYARLEGARAAAARYGMDWRAVRDWAADAGVHLESGIDVGVLEATHDLVMAQLAEEVKAGKVKGDKLARTAWYLTNLRTKHEATKPEPRPLAVDAQEAFLAWLVDRLLEADLADLDAADRAVGTLLRALMRAANAEPDRPHRTAMLAWHSGRREWGGAPIEAGGVLAWAQDLTSTWIADQDGSLVAWAAAEEAGLEAGRAARWAAVPHRLDPDLAALVAEADQLLLDWS